MTQALAECLGAPIMQWVFPATKDWHGMVQAPGSLTVVAKWTPPEQEKEMVRTEIQQHHGEVQVCYEAYLDRAPRKKRKARLVTTFAITRAGTVEDAKIAEHSIQDQAFEDCVLAVVRKMTFAANPGRDRLVISYPFTFEPTR